MRHASEIRQRGTHATSQTREDRGGGKMWHAGAVGKSCASRAAAAVPSCSAGSACTNHPPASLDCAPFCWLLARGATVPQVEAGLACEPVAVVTLLLARGANAYTRADDSPCSTAHDLCQMAANPDLCQMVAGDAAVPHPAAVECARALMDFEDVSGQ